MKTPQLPKPPEGYEIFSSEGNFVPGGEERASDLYWNRASKSWWPCRPGLYRYPTRTYARCVKEQPAPVVMDDADAVKADYNARLCKLIMRWNNRIVTARTELEVDTIDKIVSEAVEEFALEAKPVAACSRDR
jgi:hypothetical protein